MITIYRTEYVFKNIVLFWVLCALDVNCAQPTRALGCDGSKLRRGEYAGTVALIYYDNQHSWTAVLI